MATAYIHVVFTCLMSTFFINGNCELNYAQKKSIFLFLQTMNRTLHFMIKFILSQSKSSIDRNFLNTIPSVYSILQTACLVLFYFKRLLTFESLLPLFSMRSHDFINEHDLKLKNQWRNKG